MSKLAAIATHGKVYGIDHSTKSVAMAMRTNKQWIGIARVEIREASVSRLPFSDASALTKNGPALFTKPDPATRLRRG